MSKWLSLFRAVVIKPLPDQVVEEVPPEAEGLAMEEEEEEESMPKAPTTRYKNKCGSFHLNPKCNGPFLGMLGAGILRICDTTVTRCRSTWTIPAERPT